MSENPVAVTQALLPCPICGGDEISHGWSAPGVDGSASTGEVQCHSCDLLLWKETEAEAIAAWNTRALAAGLEREAAVAAAHAVCREVAELPDRASPDDWPEAMLVTAGELHQIVTDAILAALTKPTPPASVLGEVVTQADWDRAEEAFSTDAVSSDKALARLFADHRLAAAPETATPSAEPKSDTVAFVQEWLMNGDYEPTEWDRQFAAAIDARTSAVGGVDRMREASDDEINAVARALYKCESERSDHVDKLLSAAKGQPVKFRMEHWDDVAELYRSDARAALAALAALATGETSPDRGRDE